MQVFRNWNILKNNESIIYIYQIFNQLIRRETEGEVEQ